MPSISTYYGCFLKTLHEKLETKELIDGLTYKDVTPTRVAFPSMGQINGPPESPLHMLLLGWVNSSASSLSGVPTQMNCPAGS